MNRHRNNSGFSLTEMLIATGIMMIGLVMVATIFPVGVKLTALTTERTIGAVVADEAFAKIQLYGLRDFYLWPTAQLIGNPNETYITCNDFQFTNLYEVGPDGVPGTPDDPPPSSLDDFVDEFLYPSTVMPAGQPHNYHWSALCRRVGAKEVQVTVFVTRKIVAGAGFHAWDPVNLTATSDSPWPKPVPVNVDYAVAQPKELVIKDNSAFLASVSGYFFDDGYTIVDNLTGKIYRVLEVKDEDGNGLPETLVLMDDWQWVGYPSAIAADETDRTIWVVPPAGGSSRYPCVGVYQKVIRFDGIN